MKLIARHAAIGLGDVVTIDGIEIELHPAVLSPVLTKTSRFLASTVLALDGLRGRVLEVGVGSGFVLCRVGKHESALELYGVDINASAVEVAKRNLVRNGLAGGIVIGDLFGGFGTDAKFDTVIFNPPLLFGKARGPLECAIFDCDGLVIRKFLEDAKSHLEPGGQLIVLSTDRNHRHGAPSFESLMSSHGYDHKVVATLDRGFEVYSAHIAVVRT